MLGSMWLVASCVVNRNRKVGANSLDPISTSTMQRHRNPNHQPGHVTAHGNQLLHASKSALTNYCCNTHVILIHASLQLAAGSMIVGVWS